MATIQIQKLGYCLSHHSFVRLPVILLFLLTKIVPLYDCKVRCLKMGGNSRLRDNQNILTNLNVKCEMLLM